MADGVIERLHGAGAAAALVGAPNERGALESRIGRFQRAGLIPEELDLEPLVNAVLKFGT